MNRSVKFSVLALIASLWNSLPAAADGNVLCLQGCPTGALASNRVIDRPIYILSNNGKTKFADWVAYRVTKETIGRTQTRQWRADPDLPKNETLAPSDYNDIRAALNADRGHQAPLASLTGSPEWRTSNYLSNITPQSTALNQGPWKKLEDAERELAKQANVSAVYSITGPLYEHPMQKLPHAHLAHEVPSGYWKIVAIERQGSVVAAAFILHQETKRQSSFCNFSVTVGEVSKRTHLVFFPRLSQNKRKTLETQASQLMRELGCQVETEEPHGTQFRNQNP